MADKTAIEWTDATWNPVRGCTKVSSGCDNCYAMRQAHRTAGPGGAYEGLTRIIGGRPQWNGKVTLVPKLLDQPIRWKRPRLIFVNSMSDLFHPNVPDHFIDQVFAVMALAHRHTFQVLTKRPERMQEYIARSIGGTTRCDWVISAIGRITGKSRVTNFIWPLPNVWLGVSVEDQATADERIPLLLGTPAAIRWISAEPLLGPIDLRDPENDSGEPRVNWLTGWDGCDPDIPGLDWVVAGGESGPNARPMHPDWVRSLRDQCQASGVPLLFKQWGAWYPGFLENTCDGQGWIACPDDVHDPNACDWEFSPVPYTDYSGTGMLRLGKKRAGRMLDGRTWDEYPA